MFLISGHVCVDLISASLLRYINPAVVYSGRRVSFCFLVGKNENISISFAWVRLEDFGDLADLFFPFVWLLGVKGVRRICGLSFRDVGCCHLYLVFILK